MQIAIHHNIKMDSGVSNHGNDGPYPTRRTISSDMNPNVNAEIGIYYITTIYSILNNNNINLLLRCSAQ